VDVYIYMSIILTSRCSRFSLSPSISTSPWRI